ncbi:MAG: Y4yA family PLP-dependent enzyme [Actinomycetospora chiangmaiensis]|nr:Y4yA family PLP-dependent enzyme [Actinomycetospora chiangmaiensis]
MSVTLSAPLAARRARPGPPSLTPLLDPLVERVIRDTPECLHALVARHGSPLNIVWPHTVAGNVARMRCALSAERVDHAIFYGAKANKSQALIRAAVAAGVGVDVSSAAEFEDAVRAGAGAARICATGPAKTAPFLRQLAEAGALVAVDSLEELDDLVALLGPTGRARVLLRYRPRSAGRTRFGMAADAVLEGLRRVARAGARVALKGFHLHLSGYDYESRAVAIAEVAALVEAAAGLGLPARMIDIGGGLPVRYVAPEAYAHYLAEQGPEHYGTGRVPGDFYPYGSALTAADWIAGLLQAPCRGTTVAGYLRSAGLQLALEPGRSLVDQAAISLFRVIRTKPIGDGTAIVFVEGSSFSACETWFASEFLVNPILLPAGATRPDAAPLRASIAGHSCLDGDVVSHRLLAFDSAPQAGDLLIYANTAGYQMDLLENEFHRHPMPARLVAGPSPDGAFIFVRDK